jgi:hypothetical protein
MRKITHIISSNLYNKFYFVLLIIAIAVRFIFQFIYPTFNTDEISLGENIFNRSFTELLFPLDNFQSSPPLFLLIQKLFIYLPIPGWIAIKLCGFFVSVASCVLVIPISRRMFTNIPLQLIFISLIFFNPFIVYNSITVKQYGFDLLFVLLLMMSFNRILNKNYLLFIFFMTWSLLSNVGLFFAAGYLVHLMVQGYIIHGFDFRKILNQNIFKVILIGMSLIPYIIYFAWFMSQNGAVELKAFMQDYWKDAFIPLNTGIFYFSFQFIHGMGVLFMSSYVVLGYLGIVLSAIGLYYYISKVRTHPNTVISIFLYAVGIHGFLSALHFYPLSDRLYLYFAPLVFFLALHIFEHTANRFIKVVPIILFGIIILFYSTYLPYRENDVAATYRYFEEQDAKTAICSVKSYAAIKRFNDFTSDQFANDMTLVQFDDRNLDLYKNKLYVSRVHHKLGHKENTSLEEETTSSLIKANKILLVKKLDGYNVYVFHSSILTSN